MIVQACINGARAASFHPALPLTADAMARDGAACIGAGATELHLRPRGPDGRESPAPASMDVTMLSGRRVCLGTLIGVSTGADVRRTLACIGAWSELPDYASVNLEEPDARAVMLSLDVGKRAFRIMVEVSERDSGQAQPRPSASGQGRNAAAHPAARSRRDGLGLRGPRGGTPLVHSRGPGGRQRVAGRRNRVRQRPFGHYRDRDVQQAKALARVTVWPTFHPGNIVRQRR
jgi:hypothetical protein